MYGKQSFSVYIFAAPDQKGWGIVDYTYRRDLHEDTHI